MCGPGEEGCGKRGKGLGRGEGFGVCEESMEEDSTDLDNCQLLLLSGTVRTARSEIRRGREGSGRKERSKGEKGWHPTCVETVGENLATGINEGGNRYLRSWRKHERNWRFCLIQMTEALGDVSPLVHGLASCSPEWGDTVH